MLFYVSKNLKTSFCRKFQGGRNRFQGGSSPPLPYGKKTLRVRFQSHWNIKTIGSFELRQTTPGGLVIESGTAVFYASIMVCNVCLFCCDVSQARRCTSRTSSVGCCHSWAGLIVRSQAATTRCSGSTWPAWPRPTWRCAGSSLRHRKVTWAFACFC